MKKPFSLLLCTGMLSACVASGSGNTTPTPASSAPAAPSSSSVSSSSLPASSSSIAVSSSVAPSSSSAPASSSVAESGSSSSVAVAEFMQVYIGECQVCHGTEGQGTVLGPEILHPTVDYSEWIIRTGRTHPNYPAMMPSYNTNEVSDEVLADILDWLNSAPKPTTGEELYGDFCSHCHSDDGIGTTNHAAFGENPTTDIRNGHNITNFGGRTQYMPRWDNTQITDNEINLIRQYTDSQ